MKMWLFPTAGISQHSNSFFGDFADTTACSSISGAKKASCDGDLVVKAGVCVCVCGCDCLRKWVT